MEIPLFPLPNLVLFPQVAVPLHIFEERYKLLINQCIEKSEVFGLVLLREDADHEGEDTIHRVGVTARVVQVDRLADGRMNILSAGESRFRILEFTGRTPYWTAAVELFEDDPESGDALEQASDDVRRLYNQATQLTSQLKEAEAPELDLPADPVALSFMVSYILDINAARKQELLETSSTTNRLISLSIDLGTALQALRAQIARKKASAKVQGNGDLGKPH
jgi:Lon protease-like protein